MRVKSCLAVLLLVAAVPAAAQEAHAPPPLTAASARTGIADYGRWLTTVMALEKPALDAVAQIGPSWERAIQAKDPKQVSAIFRPEMARIKRVIATTNQALRAVDVPDFSQLTLTEDIQAPQIIRSCTDLNDRIGVLIDGYGPLMDAMVHNDMKEAVTASRAMIGSANLLLESQVLIVRAHQATEPVDSSDYELSALQLAYYRSGIRVLKSFPVNGIAKVDPALARDLDVLAVEADRIAVTGAERLEGELATFRRQGDEARANHEPDRAALNDKFIAVKNADRQAFPLARQLAALLRQNAAALRSQPLTMDRAGAALQSLLPVRNGLLKINNDENAAAAGAPPT